MLTFPASNVVVGGTIEALRFAKENNYHAVYSTPEPPHKLESTEEDRVEWLTHCFDLSLRGLLIAPETTSIRLLDKSLRLVGRNFFINVPFEKAYIFSDVSVVGLPEPVGLTSTTYKVLDWVTMGDGMTHEYERIDHDSEFVNHIIFYPTERLDGHHPDKKDAVAVSYIEKDSLYDVSWSESYARLKAIKLMKGSGIKFAEKKIEISHREVIKVGKNIYPHVSGVEFC